ncbi:MAG: hypothetical protein IKL35_04540 [Muribaculaceae bacterium]|nr:hypothetical protein [Muribaculaceae bacterium]
MKNESDILTKLGNDSGMKVPEGYFADFASRMTKELPAQDFENEQSPKVLPRSRWQQIRPYIYLAAMFMGIWCMMKMFNLMQSSDAKLSIDNSPALISALNDDAFAEDFYYEEYIDDYEILEDMYDEGVNTSEFITYASY